VCCHDEVWDLVSNRNGLFRAEGRGSLRSSSRCGHAWCAKPDTMNLSGWAYVRRPKNRPIRGRLRLVWGLDVVRFTMFRAR